MRKFPTAAELADMTERGFDRSVLAEQRALFERGQVAERIKADVRAAFAGVTLGEGIGLLEAQAIDDYKSNAERAASRTKDEKDDWSAIDVDSLNRCYSSLHFFDAEGLRFHLPAYLIAELEGNFGFDLHWTLCHSTAGEERFTLLSEPQRKGVVEFLQFVCDEPDYQSDRPLIEAALAGYWLQEAPK
jgi:hypothetical protein